MNTNLIEMQKPAKGGSHRVDHYGTAVDVPDHFWDAKHGVANLPALVKASDDLRRKVSRAEKAPEKYVIRMPEAMANKRQIREDDPLARAAMDWARKHGLPQSAFDELVEAYVAEDVAAMDPAKFRETQMAALKEQLGHRCDEVCQDVGQWFGALLHKDFEANPDLQEAAEELASDARGVMLLKAMRDRLTERGVPGHRRVETGALDAAGLRRLQATDAYLNSRHPDHEATVQRVREGWQAVVAQGS